MTKWLTLSLAFASFTACTINATGPNDAADNALRNETSFCNAWAKAACNDKVVMRCNRPSTDVCVAHQSAFCESLLPPTGYSSKNAQDCIDAVKAAYADAELIGAELNLVLRMQGECSHLVAGGATKGDSCTADTDCDTIHDYECINEDSTGTGTCEIPEIQTVGDPCDDPAAVCEPGTYCAELKAGGSICATSVQQKDDACDEDAECVPGYLCLTADGDTDTTCQPKLELSAACTDDSQCASGFCFTTGSPGPYCASDLLITSDGSLCDNL